jgi:hypothetical protein
VSRDPKQEKGGSNLYGNSRNNLIDHYDLLGLLPGVHACTPTSDPPDDTGWTYAGFEPDDDLVTGGGGSAGGNTSPGVNLIYKRIITTKYSCCCGRIKNRVQTYDSSFDWVVNFVIWQGGAGAWPPIHDILDPIGDYLLGQMYVPAPVTPGADVINQQGPLHMPVTSDFGKLIKDTGVPTGFCFW